MTYKNFFSSLLAFALLAASISFYACKDDKDDPAEEGRKAAAEVCDCLAEAETSNEMIACLDILDKYAKFSDYAAFVAAYEAGTAQCMPEGWDHVLAGIQAAPDFCDFFSNPPQGVDLTNPLVGMEIVMNEFMAKYGSQFYEPAFLNAVLETLEETCEAIPDWLYCVLGWEHYCGDVDLGEAAAAAGKYCDFFTANPTVNMEMGMGMIMGNPELAQYILNFSDAEFREIFFGVLGSCNAVPDWFYCQFGFTEYCEPSEPTEVELAAAEFCEFFTANPDAEMMDMMMSPIGAKYMAQFSNAAFVGALLGELQASCDAVPDWFYCLLGLTDYCDTDGECNCDNECTCEDECEDECDCGCNCGCSGECNCEDDCGCETEDPNVSLGETAAAELCEYFSTTTDTPAEQQAHVMGHFMTKYGSLMSNTIFRNAFTCALCYDILPDWFKSQFGSAPCPGCCD